MDDALRRRRAAVAAALGGVLLLVVLLALACGGGASGGGDKGAAVKPKPKPIPELPRGGRRILPDFRVVAFYGAPQDEELGTLGIGTPTQAGKRLLKVASSYRRLGKPVLPAMQLLAAVAANAPGPDGKFRTRQPDAVIARYLKAARKIKALLILDIQPGYAEFLPEVMRLRKWLVKPDVSLAIDPEWRVQPPARPGQVIGSVDAREVNAVSFWLDRLTRQKRLPQKLLLVHRFTNDMIKNQRRLKRRAHVAMVLNVDGFGGRAVKIGKYRAFTRMDRRFFAGFKLFFKEDVNILKPENIRTLRPRPDMISYE